MDTGTHKEVVEQEVALSTEAAFDAFFSEVWIGGGGLGPIAPAIVKEGDGQSHQGSIRRVPGFTRRC